MQAMGVNSCTVTEVSHTLLVRMATLVHTWLAALFQRPPLCANEATAQESRWHMHTVGDDTSRTHLSSLDFAMELGFDP